MSTQKFRCEHCGLMLSGRAYRRKIQNINRLFCCKRCADYFEEKAAQKAKESLELSRVFGKTIFKGVLKTSYVKLSFVDLRDENKKYHLYIGDKFGSKLLPWETKTVEPGYFFLDLPVSRYRIYSISIPVGSSIATEDMDIIFSNEGGKVTYIGTLEVNGVGEKIKFGGIPLLIPGFDYVMDVLDEHQEALREFQVRFPLNQQKVSINLMKDVTRTHKLN